MKLVEIRPFEYKVLPLDEATRKQKGTLMKLEGVFQRADTKNANGRVYPLSLWNKVMSDKDVSERLKNRRMVGELDHPASGATSIDRISHVVTDQTLNNDGTVTGVMEILDTPAGRIAETLFKAGVQLGVSSRGDGSVEKKGDVDEVQEDFQLETYDIVLKPSTPGAYPRIVESEEKNSQLIASAVEGLVKSTDEVDVLLECHKIISILEGCDERCKSLATEIKRKLSREVPKQIEPVEEQMSDKRTPPELSPETVGLLKEHVDRGIAEAVKEKDSKIGSLNERVVELTSKNDDLTHKLAEAEKRAEKAESKSKDLEEKIEDTSVLKVRYEAAVKLLDEAIPRIKLLKETTRRLDAAKQLIGASINKHRKEAVDAEVVKQLESIEDEEVRKTYLGLLEGCKTPTEVKRKVKQLRTFVEKVSTREREPLPSPKRSLKEQRETKPSKPMDVSDYSLSRLVERVS